MSNNGYLSRNSAKFVRQYKDVELPDGSKARIQNLNNREKEELQLSLLGADGKPNFRAAIVGQQARAIIAGWVDGEGNRILSERDESVVQDEMDPDVVEVLSSAVIEHAGINEPGIERLKKRFVASQDSSLPTS